MSDIEITMVPKDLYYHEVAYVRGLEKKNAELVAALEELCDCVTPPWNEKKEKAVIRARAALAAAGHK